ncbi:hypothetical protein G4228_014487 [Cervus hanglu yarkandensis]|nr:hypothetical protein G4228_014487 [Cervus hanglu yarkandensis]
MSRSYNDELQFLDKINKNCWRIKKGFVPNMQVEGVFYVNDSLEKLMFEELRNACRGGGVGGFLPAMKQIGNVAALPGIVHLTGQPVLIGGTMGTCSYVLTGTEQGMTETFGTTCHGAGRALSRAKSRRNLDFQDVLDKLADMGIAIRVASPKLVMEEAPESYKNVTDVVNTCHDAGISKKAIKLRPIAVIKG